MLPDGWKGSKPVQFKLPDMPYTTILQVPSSKDSRLLKAIAKIEPRLAKTTNYHAKLVEKSGKSLSKCFSKDFSSGKCFRTDCYVCKNPTLKGPSLCNVKSIVYECVCDICDTTHKLTDNSTHRGRYVGQSSRTLYERVNEHMTGLRRQEEKNFLFKHWATVHGEMLTAPTFRFRVVKCHKSPMDRVIHEAVRIVNTASMNSKSERFGYTIARIIVEPKDWEAKKGLEIADSISKCESEAMQRLRDKTRVTPPSNLSDNCRKRIMSFAGDAEPSPIPKRSKQDVRASSGSGSARGRGKRSLGSGKMKVSDKSKSVITWLLANKGKSSSTPIKDDSKKSSTSEVNVKPCEPSTAGVAVERTGCSSNSGYSADISGSAGSVYSCAENPSVDGFESTGSWFKLNVDSYCEKALSEAKEAVCEAGEVVCDGNGESEAKREVEPKSDHENAVEFGSSGSWLEQNMVEFERKVVAQNVAEVESESCVSMKSVSDDCVMVCDPSQSSMDCAEPTLSTPSLDPGKLEFVCLNACSSPSVNVCTPNTPTDPLHMSPNVVPRLPDAVPLENLWDHMKVVSETSFSRIMKKTGLSGDGKMDRLTTPGENLPVDPSVGLITPKVRYLSNVAGIVPLTSGFGHKLGDCQNNFGISPKKQSFQPCFPPKNGPIGDSPKIIVKKRNTSSSSGQIICPGPSGHVTGHVTSMLSPQVQNKPCVSPIKDVPIAAGFDNGVKGAVPHMCSRDSKDASQ